MKMLIGFYVLAMSSGSIAGTGETKTFLFNGSQNSMEFTLNAVETHVEYNYENRESTCYRSEVVNYRTSCISGSGARGGRFNTSCHHEPVFGQIPYPCIKSVAVPYDVKDFDVEARVIVDVTKLNSQLNSVEALKVSLLGDNLSLSSQGSKKFFHMLKKNVNESVSGSVKFIDAHYSVELIEAAPVLAALDMKEISFENGVLSIGLGDVTATKNIGFALNVTKRRFLRSDVVLFDRELATSEVIVKRSSASVDLEKIGMTLEGGKHSFTPKVFFKAEGTLLNSSDFGDLKTSRTLLLKL